MRSSGGFHVRAFRQAKGEKADLQDGDFLQRRINGKSCSAVILFGEEQCAVAQVAESISASEWNAPSEFAYCGNILGGWCNDTNSLRSKLQRLGQRIQADLNLTEVGLESTLSLTMRTNSICSKSIHVIPLVWSLEGFNWESHGAPIQTHTTLSCQASRDSPIVVSPKRFSTHHNRSRSRPSTHQSCGVNEETQLVPNPTGLQIFRRKGQRLPSECPLFRYSPLDAIKRR